MKSPVEGTEKRAHMETVLSSDDNLCKYSCSACELQNMTVNLYVGLWSRWIVSAAGASSDPEMDVYRFT